MFIAHFSTVLKTTENHTELMHVCTLLLKLVVDTEPSTRSITECGYIIAFLLSWQKQVKVKR